MRPQARPLASAAACTSEPPPVPPGRRRRGGGRCAALGRRLLDGRERLDASSLNVLLLIIDSLRPDHVGAYGSPQIQTPNIDALAARGLRFNRAFPEAMVTIPARRSIFTSRRIFPFRNFVPNPELGVSPGLAADRGRRAHLHDRVPPPGLLDGAGVRQPPPRLHQGLRAVPPELRPLEHRSSASRAPIKPAGDRAARDGLRWLPPVLRDDRYIPGMRKYLANSGAGVDEEETCAARVYKEALDMLDEARLRQPFCLTSTASTRTSPGARRRSTSTCTATRLRRAEDRRDPLRLRAQLHRRRAAAPPARDLRGRGDA